MKEKVGGKSAAKNTVAVLYSGAGFDPSLRTRKEITIRRRKALKRNKESESSGNSSSCGSSAEVEDGDLLRDRG